MQKSNLVFTHPKQPQMQVEVILASTSNTGSPAIYTIRMRYPRPIHGEIMTHRVFGRNARSSRAVPVRTMLNEVRNTPYVPWHWGKNQKGMQASEECNEMLIFKDFENQNLTMTREEAWLAARDTLANIAEMYMNAGYHKQNPNRLLEPFSWIDTLITATEWKNFLWLRQHKDAEPHLQDLANLVAMAMKTCVFETLKFDEWHLPYVTKEEKNKYNLDILKKLSAARCARISYKPFNGEASINDEVERYNHLVSSDRVHASPLEHQASPDKYLQGHEGPYGEWRPSQWQNPQLHGNLTGWIQARKLIPNEVYRG